MNQSDVAMNRLLSLRRLLTIAALLLISWSAQGCAWVAIIAAGTVGAASAGGGGSGGGANNTPPRITIDQRAVEPRILGPINIPFTLRDQEGSPADIVAEFSLNGSPFQIATPTASNPSLNGLVTAPDGINHSFEWDAPTDLGSTLEVQSARLRIRVQDSSQGDLTGMDVTNPFRIGNLPPVISNVTPVTTQGVAEGALVIRMTVSDTLADRAVIANYEFSIDNGQNYLPIDPNAITGGVRPGVEIAAVSEGVVVDFTWDTDLQAELNGAVVLDSVKVRLTPQDSFANMDFQGTPVESPGAFTVDNNFLPELVQLIDGVTDSNNPVILPFIIQDEESDPVSVIIQWKQENAPNFLNMNDPALNPFVDPTSPQFIGQSMENPAVRAAVLADPAVRRRLQIITEIPEKVIETKALFGSDSSRLYAPDVLGDVTISELVGANVEIGPETAVISSYSQGFLTLQTPLANAVVPGATLKIRLNAKKQGRTLRSSPDGVVHQAIWNTSADFFLGVLTQVRITPFDSRQGDLSDSVRSGFFLEGAVSVSSRSFNENGISGVEVIDFNGDQINDIVYSDVTNERIRVFRQDPNGGFMEDPNSPFPVEGTPNSVISTDINQDGRPDIAYITDDGTLFVHFQDSLGGIPFLADLSFNLPDPEFAFFRLMKKGDVNNDGLADLVILGTPECIDENEEGFLYVFLQGQGTISPAPYSPILLGVNSTFFDIGDLNNDGRNDIAVANFGDFPFSGLPADFPNSEVTVYLQDLQGGLAEAAFSPITVGRAAAGIAIGDFNGDNLNDFAVGSSVDSVVTVMSQTAQQSFIPDPNNPNPTIGGTVSDFMVSGDINGDGADDIMVITRGSENISILIQQNGQLIEPVGAPLQIAGNRLGLRSRLKLADLDGDGASELLASSFMTRLSLITQSRPGRLLAPPANLVGSQIQPDELVVKDLNGDGLQDIIGLGNGGLEVQLQNAVGKFVILQGLPNIGAVAGQEGGLAVGDVNSDDLLDIIAIPDTQGSAVVVLLQQQDGSFVMASGGPLIAGTNVFELALGDFNGDNRLDIAVSNTGDSTITVFEQTAQGGLVEAAFSPLQSVLDISEIYAVDINSDGRMDLSGYGVDGCELDFLLQDSSGVPTTAPYAPLLLDVAPGGVAFADLDNDGFMDFVAVDNTFGCVQIIYQDANEDFLEGGNSPFDLPFFDFANRYFTTAIGDFNQDGRPDFAVSRSGMESLSVLIQGPPRVFNPDTDHGSPPAALVIPSVVFKDINGDGLGDLVTPNGTGAGYSRIFQKQ